MINWKRINSKQFERLAFDYVSTKYNKLKWESTKETRDGNKDGENIFSAPLEITIKYWYEAKYSRTINKSIPKSHLDSTLVSCMLDGKVVFLAFITNAYISEDYRRRADTFAKQRDNLRIIYVNGEELENWLYENPEIEFKYFKSKNSQKSIKKDGIENYCILQNYDLHGDSFIKTNTLEIEKEYILYISFYSLNFYTGFLNTTNHSICLLSNYNRIYDDYKNIQLKPGFNSVYIPFKMINADDNSLKFNIVCNDTKQHSFSVSDIKVINIYSPKIHYSSQIETQTNLFSIVNDRDYSNGIFCVFGSAGSGKSYLINDIFSNSRNPFSTFVIRFTGDEKTDSINCYKVIILSLYGDIWKYLNIEKQISCFNEIESLMLQQIIDDKLFLNINEQISLFYSNNNSILESKTNQTQILIDDYHKLKESNIKLINSFFKWFIRQRYNCKIFVFSRPECNPIIYSTKNYEIEHLEPKDVLVSIKNNFKGIPFLDIIKNYPMPLNALHLLNIICKINDCKSAFINKTELESQMILNDIYAETNSNTCLSFGNQFIAKYIDNPIVYCIYKIENGIAFDAIVEYFSDNSYEEIYILCQERIIKESSRLLYPYHDILVSAFENKKTQRLNKTLEKFIVFAEKKKYVSKAEMFSVLIKLGAKCFWKYRNDAEEYRELLHNNAEYLQALQIAQTLKNNNKKRYNDYTAKECRNQFVLANCLKYTNSYQESNEEFEKIDNLYKTTQDMIIKSISLEAKTEIVNNLIWMLEIQKANSILDELTPAIEELVKTIDIQITSQVHTVLNYYNRKMFINYMIDKGQENDYKNAVSISRKLHDQAYIGFAKMDYAKSLYNTDLEKSLILMQEALSILEKISSEKRRTLDAKSEIWFIQCLLHKTLNYDTFYDIKNQMYKNHYIQSLIRIQLKLILLEMVYNYKSATEIISNLELVAINNSSIKSGRRHQAFIYHLYAAAYYLKKDFSNSKKYSNKSLSLLSEMGESYKSIHKHNNTLTSYHGVVTINSRKGLDEKKFILDTRIW